MLNCSHRGRRFYGRPKYKLTSVADATQNAACMIGLFFDAISTVHKGIVILSSSRSGCPKAVSDLKTLHSSDGQDGLCQIRVQLLKTGISRSCWHTGYHAFDNTTHRILFFHALFRIGSRLLRRFGVRHGKGVLTNLLPVKPAVVDLHRSDGPGIGTNGDSQLLQNLGRHCSGRHPADGFPSRGASAAPIIPETVLAVIGIIRMSRPIAGRDLTVVLGAL